MQLSAKIDRGKVWGLEPASSLIRGPFSKFQSVDLPKQNFQIFGCIAVCKSKPFFQTSLVLQNTDSVIIIKSSVVVLLAGSLHTMPAVSACCHATVSSSLQVSLPTTKHRVMSLSINDCFFVFFLQTGKAASIIKFHFLWEKFCFQVTSFHPPTWMFFFLKFYLQFWLHLGKKKQNKQTKKVSFLLNLMIMFCLASWKSKRRLLCEKFSAFAVSSAWN